MAKQMPSFFDPRKAKDFYRPNLQKAREEGQRMRVSPAGKQFQEGNGGLLLGIDWELDFADDGRLAVPGFYNDLGRFCEHMIQGTLEEVYTTFMFTIDSHPQLVIHGFNWYKGENGEILWFDFPIQLELNDPTDKSFNILMPDGTPTGKKAFPRYRGKHTVAYAQHLQATGQGNIWVFAPHCVQGTDGVTFPSLLTETIEFCSAARDINVIYVYKGFIEDTDWFGAFRPCMPRPGHPQGDWQTMYLDLIPKHKITRIAGQADEFCVRFSTQQIRDYAVNEVKNPGMLNSIEFLSDCTSPIVAANPMVKQWKQDVAKDGIKFVESNRIHY